MPSTKHLRDRKVAQDKRAQPFSKPARAVKPSLLLRARHPPCNNKPLPVNKLDAFNKVDILIVGP